MFEEFKEVLEQIMDKWEGFKKAACELELTIENNWKPLVKKFLLEKKKKKQRKIK